MRTLRENPERREKDRLASIAYYHENLTAQRNRHRQWSRNNLARIRETAAARRLRLKEQAYELLGNKCCVCGFSDRRALQIDHKNGNGHEEAKSRGRCSSSLYKRVLKDPDKYQILCANHNWIKRWEQGEHGWNKTSSAMSRALGKPETAA